MTGSPLVGIVVPIVMLAVLGIWIAIVFYAEAHPAWKHGPGHAVSQDVPNPWPAAAPGAQRLAGEDTATTAGEQKAA